jgi:hypothetical protein
MLGLDLGSTDIQPPATDPRRRRIPVEVAENVKPSS